MPKLTRNHYVLAVPDLDTSARWYERVLGCTPEVVDAGNWVFMHLDGTMFMLGHCPDAIPVPDLGDHQYFAYLVVDDLDAMHARASGAVGECGGEILKQPRDESWGMREMALRTVDGHRMMIASDLA